MSIEDPRSGDRFRVTFEGTFRAAPDRLWIGEGAGLSWGLIAEHAVTVAPIDPGTDTEEPFGCVCGGCA